MKFSLDKLYFYFHQQARHQANGGNSTDQSSVGDLRTQEPSVISSARGVNNRNKAVQAGIPVTVAQVCIISVVLGENC